MQEIGRETEYDICITPCVCSLPDLRTPIFAPSIRAPGIRSTGPSWLMSPPYASHGGVLEPLQLADQAAPDEFLRELRVGVRALAADRRKTSPIDLSATVH